MSTNSMSATQHTPGPWKAELQYGRWYIRQNPNDWNGGGYQHVCNLPAERKGSHYGDMFADNARLIANAPEMLAALQQIERLGREADGNLVDVRAMLREIARAAIAKATGQ